MSSRTIILVSPYFPPSALAGVHRVRHLAKHLPAVGWPPVVLCVDELHHVQRLDPSLAALVPSSVEVVRVGALPAKLTRCIGIGDISLRSWVPLRQTLLRLIEERSADAVFITGSPYYPMLFASEIRRRFAVPVVLDFQDPWISAWGAASKRGSKAWLAHLFAKALEPRAVRGASFITSVSAIQNEEMISRYPWLDASRMDGIPIGADPEDFAVARAMPIDGSGYGLDPKYINLSYVGSFWPAVGPSMRSLFRAFALLRQLEPRLAERVRLNFFGTNANPSHTKTCFVLPIAEMEGVADAVFETPRRLPYLEALKVLAQSDGLLLIGSYEPHYTASKIYPALMSGRPFLSLFQVASSANAILSATGGGRAISFETREDLHLVEASLAEGIRTLALTPEIFGTAAPESYQEFEARNIARRFGKIFDFVAAEKVG